MTTAMFIKEAARDLAGSLRQTDPKQSSQLTPRLIRLSETAALEIRKAAYPDMHPVDHGSGPQEVRPHQLPEGFDPHSVEAPAYLDEEFEFLMSAVDNMGVPS